MKRITLFLLFLGLSLVSKGQDMRERYKDADEYQAKYEALTYYSDVNPGVIEGTNLFWYSVNTPEGRKFYVVDADKKSKTAAFDHAKVAAYLTEDLGEPVTVYALPFTDVTFDKKANTMRFVVNGNQYTCKLSDYAFEKTKVEASSSRGYWGNVANERGGRAVSPDGKQEVYISENNVWVRSTDGSNERQLSFDGQADHYYAGDFRWSPNSKQVVCTKIKPATVRKLYLIESSPSDQLQPKLQNRDYVKPGDSLPVRRPALFDTERNIALLVDFKNPENQYNVGNIRWSTKGDYFTFVYNGRGHQEYYVYRVDVQTGNAFPSVSETSNTFIYYNALFRFDMEDRDEIVWISERDGWRHLYLIDSRNGAVKKQITKGEWVVKSVLHVNPAKREITFVGCGKDVGEDPYLEKIYKVNMDNNRIVALTPENANHSAVFTADRKYFMDVYSRVDKEPVTVLRDGSTGRVLMELEKGDVSKALAEGWSFPEVFVAKGRDGETDIWGIIKRPRNFDPDKKYPVIEYIYAGPHGSFVPKSFSIGQGIRPSALTELGFIVVQIDGMGTFNRSKKFHDVSWKNLKDAGFPDRILWMQAANKKYPSLDIDRVGIYGNSAGGQSTLGGLLFHPEFYKVGVSSCGCHDNRMDKIWWNEQWMGYPVGKEYAESSNVDNAHRLCGKLLLIVGELDDNVDPSSTLQVVDALKKANKDFDYIMVPGMGHSIGDEWVERKRRDFFVKHLMGIEPINWNRD